MREQLIATVHCLDSHRVDQAIGVDRQQDDVISAAIEEVGDDIDLSGEGAMDEALLIQ